MLDAYVRPWINPPLNFMAAGIARRGISANAVTITGFGIGLAAMAAIAWQQYTAGLVLIALNRLMDGLDGAVARQTRATDLGGFLDIVVDFIFYSGVVFAFALADPPERALAAAFLIFSYIGTGSSFLAYAIVAAKRGVTTEQQGKKAFYYMEGITEGSETILAMVLMCLLPGFFTEIAIAFGCLCWLTTLGRVGQGFKDFRSL